MSDYTAMDRELYTCGCEAARRERAAAEEVPVPYAPPSRWRRLLDALRLRRIEGVR